MAREFGYGMISGIHPLGGFAERVVEEAKKTNSVL